MAAALHPGKRREISARTRFLDFPWGSKVGWPLRELGVHVVGIDFLHGHYLGGTQASTTHLLYFMISGSVACDTGEGYRPLTAGQWASCPAHGPHWIRHGRGKSEALWVHLLDTKRWRFLRARGPGIFPIHKTVSLRESLISAVEEAKGAEYGSFENATNYSSIFGVHLVREIDRAYERQHSLIQNHLTDLWSRVNDRLNEPWTVEKLAAEIHVSPSALYMHATRHNGVNPMVMLTRLRMERAKDLLLHGNETLEKIAETVGYSTPYAFSDAFLRVIGQRPGRYRKGRIAP
jgi:AraC-like DNA-binding protein